MNEESTKQLQGRRELSPFAAPLLWALVVAILAFAVVNFWGASGEQTSGSTRSASETAPPAGGPDSGAASGALGAGSPTTTIFVHPIDPPKRIVIPAIDVDASITLVGLRDNGDMQVPNYGFAGWYELGPAPGAAGAAVIVGHVDTTRSPDVFYHLKDLEEGDEFFVYDEKGDAATFVVDSVEQQLKVDLPKERIWSDTLEPVIRLITCGGDWDRKSGHYLSNVIVYGHLVR